MKKTFAIAGFAFLLLAACGTQNTASLLDSSTVEPSGVTGIGVMTACVAPTNDCFPLEVESDGKSISRIHYPTDVWVDVVDSGCSSGYCWAKDANGGEWKLEP